MAQKSIYELTLEINTNSAALKKGVDDVNRKVEGLQNNIGSQLQKVQGHVIAATAVLGTLKGVLETVKKGMNETGEGADNLERFTIKLKAGFDSLAKSIVQADFSNMINNWKTASKAAGEYADSMDLVDDRLKDLSVKRASVASSVQMLRAKQAEGTLTKAEAVELKKNTEDLLKIETDIYNAAIAAQVKFISDKNNLNAELFKTLENGINKRVEMSESEIKSLDDQVAAYKKFKEETIKANTELVEAQTTGGGMMGNSGSTTMVVNYQAVNKALEEYISNQSDVVKLQIFQQSLASGEDYDKLIEFYIKRNNLEGEYAGLLRGTIKAENKGSVPSTPITRVSGVSPVSTSNILIPSLAPNVDTTKLTQPAKVFKESWIDALTKTNEQVQTLGSSFMGLADVIDQSMSDGKVSFGEAMKIVQESAMTTISILGALAAANIITKEAQKGLVGIVTAVAGLGLLLEVWSKFVSPDRYATGTSSSPEGWAIVGEQGPERVWLPRGSRVDTAAQTANGWGMGNNGSQEVRLRLVGTDLVGAVNMQVRSNNSFR